MACEQGVFPIQSDRADHVFHAVGVVLDTAILKEGLQAAPVVMDIGELFAKPGFSRHAQALLLQPLAEGGKAASAS